MYIAAIHIKLKPAFLMTTTSLSLSLALWQLCSSHYLVRTLYNVHCTWSSVIADAVVILVVVREYKIYDIYINYIFTPPPKKKKKTHLTSFFLFSCGFLKKMGFFKTHIIRKDTKGKGWCVRSVFTLQWDENEKGSS